MIRGQVRSSAAISYAEIAASVSLSRGEDLIEILSGDDFSVDLLAGIVELHLVPESVLVVTAEPGVAWGNHAGIGQQDAVEGEAGSLNGVLVHFYLIIIII